MNESVSPFIFKYKLVMLYGIINMYLHLLLANDTGVPHLKIMCSMQIQMCSLYKYFKQRFILVVTASIMIFIFEFL